MTEKRFKVSEYTDKIHDKLREEEYYFEDKVDWYKLCGLLNALNEENEQLKQQNEHLEKQIKCITQSLQNELNNYGFR